MSASRSMHHFYNRTWNERSLQKYANGGGGSHNYENVYSNESFESDGHASGTPTSYPNYENIWCKNNNEGHAHNTIVINQLTCSPGSVRRGGGAAFYPPQPDCHAPPVPPERKGRGRRRKTVDPAHFSPVNNPYQQQQYYHHSSQHQQQQAPRSGKPLYRSKSCERPKMREAMRDTFRISSEKFTHNFNRLSSNLTEKLTSAASRKSSAEPSQQQQHVTSGTSTSGYDLDNSLVPLSHSSSGNLFQAVAFRAIPCVDVQVRPWTSFVLFTSHI